jgi:DNA-binding response OmpR family regulator
VSDAEPAAVQPLALVVDDEPKNLQVVGALLRSRGFRVAVATSGARAIELARQSLPDVILLDVMMPTMDGFETCRRLKRDLRTAGIPILFLTARAGSEDAVEGFRVGGADYIRKPFHADELVARVQTHAELHRLRGLLTICSGCQRIRNESSVWERLDFYVAARANVTFSHGLCQDCLDRLYPEDEG